MKKKFDLGKMIFALAVIAGLSGAFAGTAKADERREWQDHRWEGHEREVRGWRWHHVRPEPYIMVERRVIYAPPVLVQEPLVMEAPGYNIVIPLNIR